MADLLRAAAAKPLHLRTGLGPLDSALLGGLPAGSVTEVGAPALLASAFCICFRCSVAASCCWRHSCIVQRAAGFQRS